VKGANPCRVGPFLCLHNSLIGGWGTRGEWTRPAHPSGHKVKKASAPLLGAHAHLQVRRAGRCPALPRHLTFFGG